VLDEADRMFDLGFIKDIRFLLRRMPVRTERQTLLFSATLSHRVLELAYEHMNEPEKMVVESEHITNAKVRQRLYLPADDEKLPLLLGLLSRSEGARTMVFVNTKAFVERVARALERAGYRVGVLSGDVPQKKRESLLKKFQAGQLEILVATDVAARGLHIDGVSHVYNYDLPFDAEDYVHRIGRTARLGAEGDAISFACERYAMSLPDIEAYIEQKLPTEQVTADMLVALPRAPRAKVEGEEEESVSAIFREAREQKAEDDARRGIKPRSGGRSGAGAARDGERRPRGPKPEGARPPRAPRTETASVVVEASVAAAKPADAAPVTPRPPRIDPVTGEALAPRKRRRRRKGKPVDGASAEAGATTTAARPERTPRPPRHDPRPARAAGEAPVVAKPQDAKPGLLGRVARGLKSLITRAPRNQH
jgi:ATP-dependent RNA helicase RhlB